MSKKKTQLKSVKASAKAKAPRKKTVTKAKPVSKPVAKGKAKTPTAKKGIKLATRKTATRKTASVKAKPAPKAKAASKSKPTPKTSAKKATAKKLIKKAVKVKPPAKGKTKPTPPQKAKAVVAKKPQKTPPQKSVKSKAPNSRPTKKVAPKKALQAVKPTPKPTPAPVPVAKPAPAPSKKAKRSAASAAPPPPDIAPAQPPVIAQKPDIKPTATGALFYDSHMHTPLCKHAWGEPEDYSERGVRAGMKGIIFTCHCPMPDGFWPGVRMAESEFDLYVDIVTRAAKTYEGRLDVRLGLESEYFPGMEPWIEKLHQRADFHYILCGVHWQSREYLAKFETGTIENFRRTYFKHLADAAETGLYDCIAHPDLVKNYHPDSWCFAIIKDTVATTLDRIAKTGVAMEMNTSGLNKSYSEMNPGQEMLRMMADRKIPIVVGSDAHRAHRVGEGFVIALQHLQEVGYESVSYFLNRERIDLKITSILNSIKKAAAP